MEKEFETIVESISLDRVVIGDIVLIKEDDEVEYRVLDVGNPFILIQNLETHFAYLFEPFNNKLFKKIKKKC